MTTPYRTAPALVYVAPLPELRTDRCPGCGEKGLTLQSDLHVYRTTVRPCSWWRRLLGCREERPHVHCQHGRCGWRWTAAPAGHR